MAFSTTAAIIAAAAAVAAAGVTAYAAVKQGEAADKNARFNAKLAEREAMQKKMSAEAAAEDARRRHERVLATQRAQYGASGIDPNEGSSLLVMMDSQDEAALDEARIRWGGREEATTLQAEANVQRWRGRQAKAAGYLGAGAAILGGLSSAAGAYSGRGGSGGGIGYGAASTPPAGNHPY